MTLRKIFNEKKFITTVELPPPRGVNTENILKIAAEIKNKIDAVNVTDNQRAIMRMSALAFSAILKNNGLEPILQICCRDRNRIALQSDLLGAYALGIRNLCIMSGDHPILGDQPEAKAVFDLDSIQLMKVIKKLEDGFSLSEKPLEGSPQFYYGGVVNPHFSPFGLQLIKLEKKVESGAEFFQTQPLFTKESVEDFLNEIKGIKAKFLIGITPLRSLKMAHFMNEKVLTSPIPSDILNRLEKSADPLKEGFAIASDFISRIRNMVDGIHIMAIGAEKHLPELLNNL